MLETILVFSQMELWFITVQVWLILLGFCTVIDQSSVCEKPSIVSSKRNFDLFQKKYCDSFMIELKRDIAGLGSNITELGKDTIDGLLTTKVYWVRR